MVTRLFGNTPTVNTQPTLASYVPQLGTVLVKNTESYSYSMNARSTYRPHIRIDDNVLDAKSMRVNTGTIPFTLK